MHPRVQSTPVTLGTRDLGEARASLSEADAVLVDRYVAAFERYDVDALTALLHEDATLSMPPYTLWLRGPDAIRAWLLGRGSGCRGSRLVPTAASGAPAFGQYRPAPGGGHAPWALVVLDVANGRISGWTSFPTRTRCFRASGSLGSSAPSPGSRPALDRGGVDR
jgi:RNA polymerase sigma-70 factor (ECF subfamily)